MPYLFIIGFVAFFTHQWSGRLSTGRRPPGLVTWISVLIMGLAWSAFGIGFLLLDGWPALTEMPPRIGLDFLFVVAINFFILIGPYGNALFWGVLGLWCLKKAFDGGWYRGALEYQKMTAEDERKFLKKEQAERRARQQRDWARGERRKRFETWGMAVGRGFGRFMGWLS